MNLPRSYESSPSFEKYSNRKKKGQPRNKKPPTRVEMVRRARQRIIGAVHKKGNGFIMATKSKDAVAVLKHWVRNDDGKLGRGTQVFNVLQQAFNELCRAEVFSKTRYGFKLNPHTVIQAA